MLFCHLEKRFQKCEFYEKCPYKHSRDIAFGELFLPRKKIKELEECFFLLEKYEENLKDLQKIIGNKGIGSGLKCGSCEGFIKEEIVFLDCGHSYCKECVQQAIQIRGKCPMCARPVKVNQWKEESSGYMKEVLEMLRNLLVMIDPQQSMISCSQDLLAGTAAVLGAGIGGVMQHPHIGH